MCSGLSDLQQIDAHCKTAIINKELKQLDGVGYAVRNSLIITTKKNPLGVNRLLALCIKILSGIVNIIST